VLDLGVVYAADYKVPLKHGKKMNALAISAQDEIVLQAAL
jgi:hypothetical protein